MKTYNTRTIAWMIALLCSVMLSACVLPEDGDFCVAADDWGYPKVKIKARHSLKSGEDAYTQFVDWESGDRPQVVIAPDQVPLVLAIHKDNKWTSWFNGLTVTTDCTYSGNTCSTIKKSQGLSFAACDPSEPPLTPSDLYADCYAPCWLKEGYGLYMLSSPDPDRARDTAETEWGDNAQALDTLGIRDNNTPPPEEGDVTVHLGGGDANFDDGEYIYLHNGLPSALNSRIERNHRLSFKIMDTFYADNAGGYTVHIKSGTKDAKPGPLESTVEIFESIITITAKYLYKSIVNNPEFIRTVQAILILYIALYGFKFMLGQSSATGVGNFVTHIFKVGLVVQLISETSWEFFYVYLFRIFTEGVPELLGLLVTPFENYDPTSAWATIDMMLKYLLSHETWTKAFAIFWSHPGIGGFIIVVIAIAIGIFIGAIALALLIYLQAYMLMGILLILFPPLLILILFGKTKAFFDEWIKQMTAIAVQFILLFAGLGLFSMLIMGYMQKTMGYKACLAPIYIGNQGIGEDETPPWTPWRGADYMNYFFGTVTASFGIPFPNVHDTKKITLPNGEERYRDAPYLDTENNAGDEKRFDKVTTERLYFLNILDAIPFLFAVYLAWKFFRHVLPMLAGALKGSFRTGKAESAGIFGLGEARNAWAAAFGKTGNKAKDSWLKKRGKDFGSSTTATVATLGMNKIANSVSGYSAEGKKKAAGSLGRRGGLLGGIFAAGYTAQEAYRSSKSGLTSEQREEAESKALAAKKQEVQEELKEQEKVKEQEEVKKREEVKKQEEAAKKDEQQQQPENREQEERAKRAGNKKAADPRVHGLKQQHAELQRYIELLNSEARGAISPADKAQLEAMKASMPGKAAAEAQINTLTKNISDMEGE